MTILMTAVALVSSSTGRAAPDPATEGTRLSGFEVVVVEAQGCIYCPYFRRDVFPAYQASQRAAQVPLRFVDVDALGALALAGPIDRVPTALIVKDGREVGRIAGYVGRSNFFHSLDSLIAATP